MIRWPNIGLWGQFEPCEQGILQAINYNFEVIDSLIQMAVIDFADNLPVDPEIGDKYILRSDNSINIWNGTGWDKIIPKPGYLSYVGGTGAYGDPYTDGRFFYFTGIEWRQFEAGGSGQGVKNYFPNPEFVNGFEGASLYENTGGYVDGQGGSPDVTMAIDSLTPISGEATLRMIKPSQNTINQGWSFDSILIDPQDQNRDFYFGFTIDLRDPNYIADDIEIIFYDVDNSAVLGADYIRDVISLADISTLAGGIFKVRAKVQGMNTTHVRMSVNVKTSSSVAFNIGMDVLIMSPDVIPVTLGELHDVVITNPQTGQVLFFQSPNWINKRLQAQDVDYAGYGSTVKDELDYKTLVDIHQNSRLSNAEGDIGSLDVRVGTAESDIDALELQALDFVKGPSFAAATDGNLAAFDMTSGRLIKEVPVNATNDGNVTTPGNLDVRSIDTQESTILGDSKSFFKTLGLWTKYKNVVPGPTPEPDPLGTPDADFTFTHDDSNTNPYGRIGSLRIGKPSLSGDVQGNGGFLNQFIEKAMRGAWAEFSYSHINLGGYIPNSLKVFVYDVTNSAWLDIVGDANVPANEGIHRIKFYIPSNTENLRIFTHMTSTEASTLMAKLIVGYDIKPVDPVSVPFFEQFDASPVITGLGTVTNNIGKFTVQGPTLNGLGAFTTGTPAASIASMSLPRGYNINSSSTKIVGIWWNSSSSVNGIKHGTLIMDANSNTINFGVDDYTSGVSPTTARNGSTIFVASETIYYELNNIPITQLQNNTTQGLAVNSNPATLVVTKTGGSTSGASPVTSWSAPTKSVNINFNATTGIATITQPGDYDVIINAEWLAVQNASFGILLNGVTVPSSYIASDASSYYKSGSMLLPNLKAGDTLAVIPASSSPIDLTTIRFSIAARPFSNTALMAVPDAELYVDGSPGTGSTNTFIRRFTNIRKNTANGYLNFVDSATLGSSVTVLISGNYEISYNDYAASGTSTAVFSVNCSSLGTNPSGLTYTQGLRGVVGMPTATLAGMVTRTLKLSANDVIRFHTNTTSAGAGFTNFQIKFLGYVS